MVRQVWQRCLCGICPREAAPPFICSGRLITASEEAPKPHTWPSHFLASLPQCGWKHEPTLGYVAFFPRGVEMSSQVTCVL